MNQKNIFLSLHTFIRSLCPLLAAIINGVLLLSSADGMCVTEAL